MRNVSTEQEPRDAWFPLVKRRNIDRSTTVACANHARSVLLPRQPGVANGIDFRSTRIEDSCTTRATTVSRRRNVFARALFRTRSAMRTHARCKAALFGTVRVRIHRPHLLLWKQASVHPSHGRNDHTTIIQFLRADAGVSRTRRSPRRDVLAHVPSCLARFRRAFAYRFVVRRRSARSFASHTPRKHLRLPRRCLLPFVPLIHHIPTRIPGCFFPTWTKEQSPRRSMDPFGRLVGVRILPVYASPFSVNSMG